MSSRFKRVADGRLTYESPWLAVRELTVCRDGESSVYPVVERRDAVVVIPITPAGRTILVRQFRFPTNESGWEFPMGGVHPAEPTEAAARRELAEEVGATSDRLTQIGEWRPAPGLTAQRATVWVARCEDATLDRLVSSWTSSEELETASLVSLQDIASMIGSRRITDGFTLTAFLLLQLWMAHDTIR